MKLIISILLPNLIGLFGNVLGSPNEFNNIIKPWFTPPKLVFPIVWVILFILMGIASYIVYKSDNKLKIKALTIYIINLIVNALYNLFFFNLKCFFFSFIWILILLSIVVYMTFLFYKINKIAGYLLIPYIMWLLFALVLSFGIFILN